MALATKTLHALPAKLRRAFRVLRGKGDYRLLEGRIEHGIGLHHFNLRPDGFHPFVRAIQAGIREPAAPQAAIERVLGEYYSRVKPQDAADWLGEPGASAARVLADLPPHAVTMPWQANSPQRWLEVRENGIPNENRLAGDEMPISEGWHACGPVSARKIAVEGRRLCNLLVSFQKNGLMRHEGHDGDIDSVLLRGAGGERWWINSGHHRAAVMSALGYETAPVRIKAVVDVADAANWPQVASGLFDRQEAIRFVEGLIADERPRVTDPWTTWVRTADAAAPESTT